MPQHPTSQRRGPRLSDSLAALISTVLLALLAGCSASDPSDDLPPATALLTRSADAMRTVQTAAVAIEVDPAATAVPIRSATGRLTADGQADGTAVISLFGSPPVEYQLVVTGGTLYLKGATGGYQKLPLAVATGIYDPTAVLNPERGIAALLSSADNPTTQARETTDGVDSYRVAATFRPEQVTALVPGVTGAVPGVVWLDAATSRLVKAQLQLPDGQGAARGGPVTVRLSDYDAPVTITAPS